jgi:malic enzyme
MGTEMDAKTTRKLERELEQAIAGIVARLGFRKLPLLPSQHTMHLMAKAAVAVYKAAVENQRSGE